MPGIAWEQPRVPCIIEFAKLVAGDTVEEHCALQRKYSTSRQYGLQGKLHQMKMPCFELTQ